MRFKLLIFSLYLVPFALYLSFIWYARPDSNGRPTDSKSYCLINNFNDLEGLHLSKYAKMYQNMTRMCTRIQERSE